MIVITGATGHLGRLVIAKLLAAGVPGSGIAAAVRTPEKAADLAALGVEVRHADYDRPETVRTALAGAESVLLISSSEITRDRVEQHRAVVDAAVAAGVGLLVYTSILGGDRSGLRLADDHKATEKLVLGSGLAHVILRTGWYLENYTPALEHGAIVGSAGPDARVATATRAEFAEAAAAVLLDPAHREPVYELSGDTAWSLAAIAAELGRQTGTEVTYRQLSEAEHRALLVGAGLPEVVAEILADADAGVGRGELATTSGDLSRLLGRPTASLSDGIAAALRA